MKTRSLTSGNILKSLVSLALPIMGTSFIQMAYNFTDMIWIGRLGSLAVTAIGTASFFTWFGQSFVIISKIGSEVSIAQHIGANDMDGAKHYVVNGIKFNLLLALLYSIFLISCQNLLIGFFKLNDASVVSMSKTYLVIVALGLIFNFINPMLTGLYTAQGNSSLPFKINTMGLIFNIVFDPVFIFVFKLGVAGAAIATVLAQIVVTILFIYNIKQSGMELFKVNFKERFNGAIIKKICSLGWPVALQNGLFSFFAMVIGRIITGFGDSALAVQQIGSQIESISWMTADGFATAIRTFVAQNFGAKKPDRIEKGYKVAISVALVLGLFASSLLILGAEPIFSLFIQEKDIIPMGVDYLRILGLSQLFMCIEITTAGTFNGLGKTLLPSIISIVLTGARIPFSMLLSKPDMLGLNGVWWVISMSSVVKGIIMVTLFYFMIYRKRRFGIENTL
ncbi:putative efflux protein, MATE family [Hathewaya proteolytica DSM 3090]|uniref:Probable multidrug resistance protein NorM n=2 Tax=Hathewaya proteolytica TaxID=29365 RepID=A0A1M6MHI0_9CLOT|nr:putative efflux protein, MATE family [Hathewaya proteolytica DSM 3090]